MTTAVRIHSQHCPRALCAMFDCNPLHECICELLHNEYMRGFTDGTNAKRESGAA